MSSHSSLVSFFFAFSCVFSRAVFLGWYYFSFLFWFLLWIVTALFVRRLNGICSCSAWSQLIQQFFRKSETSSTTKETIWQLIIGIWKYNTHIFGWLVGRLVLEYENYKAKRNLTKSYCFLLTGDKQQAYQENNIGYQ